VVSHGLLRGRRLSVVDKGSAGAGAGRSGFGSVDAASAAAHPRESGDPAGAATSVTARAGGNVTTLGGGGAFAAVGNAVRALAAQPLAAPPPKPAVAKPAIADAGFKPAGTYAKSETTVADDARDAKAREADLKSAARLRGYQGDSCGECGNFTLVRNGTCLKCDTCGATTGCS
jgi:ribonucleoside-diphosphate reductase alpha chain